MIYIIPNQQVVRYIRDFEIIAMESLLSNQKLIYDGCFLHF